MRAFPSHRAPGVLVGTVIPLPEAALPIIGKQVGRPIPTIPLWGRSAFGILPSRMTLRRRARRIAASIMLTLPAPLHGAAAGASQALAADAVPDLTAVGYLA